MSRNVTLPIDGLLPALVGHLERRGAVVLQAAPGAGKTTRVPAALLGMTSIHGQILVLEPRRIAARAAAARVAHELGEPLGGLVGYQVRLESRTSPRTRIVFMTEGILTRRLMGDPLLTGVGAVVLDELHERHLHTDIALALVANLRRTRRADLRVIAMSATLDAKPVADLLDAETLVCDVPAHPVTVEYAPSREPLEVQVAIAARRALRETSDGHVLVFLPGAAEIRKAEEKCRPLAREEGVRVLPLHGSLPAAEQDAVLAPSTVRKVILSTNVAESSLTIDGVRTVIDAGLARVARQEPGSTVLSLRTERTSRASAIQRAGRAGRTGPGRCIRLYPAFDFETRPAFDEPEIARADLCELVLTVLVSGERPEALPWLSPPRAEGLDAARALLERLGVLAANGLTALGRRVARLPVHPRVARVMLAAEEYGLGESGAAMGALLLEEVGDGREDAGTNFWTYLERLEEALLDGRPPEHTERHARGSLAAALRSYRQLVRHVDPRPLAPSTAKLEAPHALSLALLAGFPDRVARRSGRPEGKGGPGAPGTLTTCQGREAAVRDLSVVGGDGTTLILDAHDGGPTSVLRVRSAIPLRADWVLDAQGEHVTIESTVEIHRETGRIESVDRLRYGRLVLDETRSSAAGTEAGAEVLLAEFLARGLDRKDDLDALRRRGRRAEGAGFSGLEAQLHDTLAGAARNVASIDELAAIDLGALFLAEHPEVTSALARLAPATVRLPCGRDLAIAYPVDAPPFVESYLQDFFGMSESPRVGATPVTVQLWAPNRRPVQVTSDLASFWRTTYPELRRSLMRRYPRHHWPEDPTDAKATRFARNA
ncbi:MAG: ATP-dependent helicase HrpB [Deltaproteobacteria bacterium]|nr:ATP-dependent helicase HrpB [Deltaproteobacteria bacterium]